MRGRARTLLALAGLVAGAAQAQPTAPPAVAPPALGVETRLVRDLNRYRYDGRVDVALAPGRWTLDGTGRLASDAFELFGGNLLFRDEWEAALTVLRPWGPRLHVGAATRTQAFSQSRVLSHQSMLVARFAPRADLTGEVRAGVALDRRPGVPTAAGLPALRTDRGPGVAGALRFAPSPRDFNVEAELRGAWASLAPRRSADAGFRVQAARDAGTALFGLTVEGARVRRDAYQAASFLNRTDGLLAETVEATTSDTLLAGLTFEVPVARALRLTSRLDLGANARQVRTLRAARDALFFDTNFSRQGLDYEGALAFEQPDALVRLSVRAGADAERRVLVNRAALPPIQAAQKGDLLRQADHDRSVLALGLATRASRGRLTAFADGLLSILRHDTPDLNPDDRDEARHTASAGIQWQPRPTLALDVTGFGSWFHTVYLKRQRSGENNRQRSVRLRPALRWTPAPFSRLELQSEVRATYTTADALLPGRASEDQAARELRYELDAEHAFAPALRGRLRATLSDLRLGRLVRGRFAEIPFDTIRTYTLDARLQRVRRATVEVGARLFLRRDTERSITLRYQRVDDAGAPLVGADGTPAFGTITRAGRSWRQQVGPVVRVSWPLGAASSIELDGWYALQHLSYTLFGALPERDAPAIRRAARRGQHDRFPNVSLAVRWALF